uniref:Uncharacterized protein n=1 Tax=Drosophila melanogaster TaxID=7227 RepID=A0A1Z1CH08_DROME|nr:uncharacterized protein Dmel_CG46310 [Drosophila melanogaster]API64941.1 uncharacterized protein Dmel_CG46310 [Drosophila melanogaster]|eukprot:NP_001334697.1 uncharacterized protein Dmel_CG46310 [Drosophila melanogaster]
MLAFVYFKIKTIFAFPTTKRTHL